MRRWVFKNFSRNRSNAHGWRLSFLQFHPDSPRNSLSPVIVRDLSDLCR